MKVIKQYNNRKYYDTEESRYISLNDIEKFTQRDVDFKVLDHSTKRDITKETLVSLVCKNEFNNGLVTPINLLKDIVKEDGTFTGFIKKKIL